MKTTLTTLAALASLALTGCATDSSGTPEESARAEAGTTSTSTPPPPPEPSSVFPASVTETERYDNIEALVGDPALEGYWALYDDGKACSDASHVDTAEVRDPATGERVPYTHATCWVSGTNEQVDLVVYEGADDVVQRTAAASCDPENLGVTCLPGNGWEVSVLEGEEPALAEVLEALEVEPPGVS